MERGDTRELLVFAHVRVAKQRVIINIRCDVKVNDRILSAADLVLPQKLLAVTEWALLRGARTSPACSFQGRIENWTAKCKRLCQRTSCTRGRKEQNKHERKEGKRMFPRPWGANHQELLAEGPGAWENTECRHPDTNTLVVKSQLQVVDSLHQMEMYYKWPPTSFIDLKNYLKLKKCI